MVDIEVLAPGGNQDTVKMSSVKKSSQHDLVLVKKSLFAAVHFPFDLKNTICILIFETYIS